MMGTLCGAYLAPKRLQDTSWEEISKIAQLGLAPFYFMLGETKTITLKNGSTIELRIIGFDHDEGVDGRKLPISFETVQTLNEDFCMNDDWTNVGGWAKSKLRRVLNTDMYENLPPELKTEKAWVNVWNGSKVPMQSSIRKAASSVLPETWSDFDTAAAAVENEVYDGLGYVFHETGLVGIDIDTGYDGKFLSHVAADIIGKCRSYTEKSRSGRGFHILVRGTIPFKGKNNRAGVEIYQSSRYFIMTGNVLLFREVAENQAALDYVVETYFPETQKEGGSTSVPQRIYTPIYKRPESGKVRLSPEYPPILPGCRNLSLTSLAGQLHASVSPVSIICKTDRTRNAEAANPMLASLKGKRFVTMAESNQYGKLDEETIKQLTGGEEIKARNLYETASTFLPQFTLWLSCNDLPSVNDKSLFASDRVRVVEFNRHFTEEEQDKGLKAEFQTQEAMQGIFSWLIAGYFKYRRFGLKMSEPMRQVIRQYERDNDLVLQFLEEKCERDDEALTRAKALYDSFKIWCKSNGYFIPSAKRFNADLEAHPEWHDGKTVYHGYPNYRGVKLKGSV